MASILPGNQAARRTADAKLGDRTRQSRSSSYSIEVTTHSQFAIERIRRCVAASGPRVTEEALEIEGQAFHEMMESHDALEGIQAFFEKREPRFTHRRARMDRS